MHAHSRRGQSLTILMFDLGVVWVVGVLAAIPVVLWWVRDVSRIPGRAWYWTGHHRNPWQWAVSLGWVAGGWPAMIVVLVWSQSAERKELSDEAAAMRANRHRR